MIAVLAQSAIAGSLLDVSLNGLSAPNGEEPSLHEVAREGTADVDPVFPSRMSAHP